ECTCADKFIPSCYLTSSVESRLQLLAGLIDTDGHVSCGTTVDINLKSKSLIDGISFIAKSLGFYCSPVKSNIKRSQNGTPGTYYRIYISSPNLHTIPTKIKKIKKKKLRTDPLRTGFEI